MSESDTSVAAARRAFPDDADADKRKAFSSGAAWLADALSLQGATENRPVMVYRSTWKTALWFWNHD